MSLAIDPQEEIESQMGDFQATQMSSRTPPRWDAELAEVSNYLLCDSNKRPGIVISRTLTGGDIVIDYITCVVGKSGVVELAATTPLHAADAGSTTKCNNWEHLVQPQGDTFLPLAAEDTGALHEEAVDLLTSAASAAGGTAGERQAFLKHWQERRAILCATTEHECSEGPVHSHA